MLFISADTESRKYIKKNKGNFNQVFIASSLKDGLRNLIRYRVDTILIDMNLTRVLRGAWLKKISLEKDLKNGELAVLLLAPRSMAKIEDFTSLTKQHYIQDIFWLSEGENILQNNGFLFFLSRNIEILDFKRSNALLTQENSALLQSKRANNSVNSELLSLLVGPSRTASRLRNQVNEAVSMSRPLLLMGEQGAELHKLAKYIHFTRYSTDRKADFALVELSTLPKHLQEQRIFGYKKSINSGLSKGSKGVLGVASKGTIFISGIEMLNWNLQSTLLKAIQSGEYSRPGERKKNKLEANLIFASYSNLEKAVEVGKFRQDLLYKIKVFPIEIPGLKNRKSDIPEILDEYVKRYNKKKNTNIALSPEAKLYICNQDWPGNVAQLKAYIAAILPLHQKNMVHLKTLMKFEAQKKSDQGSAFFREEIYSPGLHLFQSLTEGMNELPSWQDVERTYLIQVLDKCYGNYSQAARVIGITRKTLYTKMKKYRILNNRASN